MQENKEKTSETYEGDIVEGTTSDNNSSNNEEQTTKSSKPKIIEIATSNTLFGYFLGAMIIFGICFVCNIFLFQIMFKPIKVVGSSMLPTINNSAKGVNYDIYNDTVYYIKVKNYKSKDIVVINEGKTDSGKKIIKRIVALPGQKVTFKKIGETLSDLIVEYYVDDVLMNDDYTLEQEMKISKSHESREIYQFHNTLIEALQNNVTIGDKIAHQYSFVLGSDEYFVMGDNRNSSTDSRMFGAVKTNEIAGAVVIHVKYGQTLIRAIWQAMFGNCLLFA